MSVAVVNAKSAWTVSGRTFDAVLAIDGRIALTGSSADVMARAKALEPPVPVVDLQRGRSIYPGFVDAHLHFMDGGRSLTALSLRGCSSRSQFVAAIRQFIVQNACPPGTWIRGGEWSEVELGAEPDRTWIDEATTEHFVLLQRFDLHSALCSSSTLQMVGVGALAEDPPGGRIERSPTGEPTGLLREKAIELVKKHWPANDTAENNSRAATAAAKYLLARGITAAFSMSSLSFSNMGDTMFLSGLAERGEMQVRVRNAVTLPDVPALHALYEARAVRDELPWRFGVTQPDSRGWFLRLGAIKFFADGSLGSKTAAMTEPYSNDKCNCGVLCIPEDQLREGFVQAATKGFQCVCHAIGDRALEVVLGGFENCHAVVGASVRQLRPRVEHCQHVHALSQLDRMAALGVTASVQPCHLLFDGSYVERLIGPERKNRTYLFRTMLDKGVQVVFGSDWMVAPADVVDNLQAAVQRVPHGEQAAWNDLECVTPHDALAAYTADAARAMHEEQDIGQLEEGFLADMSIWDGDVVAYLSGQVAQKPTVAMTIVGGVVMFSA